LWLAPASASVYRVREFTVAGAEDLLRLLTGQPAVLVPELGPVPPLPPLAGFPAAAMGVAGSAGAAAGGGGVPPPAGLARRD
jgi:hypothetical protein